MNINSISTLIRFNYWANERILTTCEDISLDQFTRAVTPDPGWGSLRGILVHMLDTEYGWRTSLQAMEDIILDESDFPDVAALRARWEMEKAAWFGYVDSLTDESLNRSYGDENRFIVWQTIMHVAAHSIQHRSEAAFILTGYGHSPGELDFGIFLSETA
ncbi:MAG: DinB family protein [Chloroflexota bacterium]